MNREMVKWQQTNCQENKSGKKRIGNGRKSRMIKRKSLKKNKKLTKGMEKELKQNRGRYKTRQRKSRKKNQERLKSGSRISQRRISKIKTKLEKSRKVKSGEGMQNM